MLIIVGGYPWMNGQLSWRPSLVVKLTTKQVIMQLLRHSNGSLVLNARTEFEFD